MLYYTLPVSINVSSLLTFPLQHKWNSHISMIQMHLLRCVVPRRIILSMKAFACCFRCSKKHALKLRVWTKTFLSKSEHFRKIYFEISSQSRICVLCVHSYKMFVSTASILRRDVYCSVEFIQFMWMVVFCPVFQTNTWFGTFSVNFYSRVNNILCLVMGKQIDLKGQVHSYVQIH